MIWIILGVFFVHKLRHYLLCGLNVHSVAKPTWPHRYLLEFFFFEVGVCRIFDVYFLMQAANYTWMIQCLLRRFFCPNFALITRIFVLGNISRLWFRRHLVLGIIDSRPLPWSRFNKRKIYFLPHLLFSCFYNIGSSDFCSICFYSWAKCENRFAIAVKGSFSYSVLRSINQPCSRLRPLWIISERAVEPPMCAIFLLFSFFLSVL